MTNFTPYSALLGGIMIGLAAAMLLYLNGRMAGVSGIFGGLLHFRRGETLWRVMFVGGLLSGGYLLAQFLPHTVDIQIGFSAPMVMLAGLIVGIGSRMGSGCTSGHGICGVSRLAPRSLVATLTFMAFGVLTAIAVDRFIVAGGL